MSGQASTLPVPTSPGATAATGEVDDAAEVPSTAATVEPLTEIVVVVPIRDEQTLLGRALDAIAVACDRVDVPTRVVCVLDRSSDDSERIATASGAQIVVSELGRAGGARRMGVTAALARMAVPMLPTTWIANTDADSIVPPDWLREHRALADTGADLVVGTVEPDSDDVPESVMAVWRASHLFEPGHDHVFGANLGVRATAYIAAGGFADVPLHEDLLLVRALRESGVEEARVASTPVVTSGRRSGRAPGGFADYVATLS
ncbi:glycosyltransferase [Frigoribacterium sp. 2-23]|uniref:glycosyltransferase n=1 Tax=Frigoribacterium sp. 2-23 TaxID=3415006 RepID=UPI003C7041E0